MTHGVRYGGGQGPSPQFLEKINEFLKFTIDFLIILRLWPPRLKPVADSMEWLNNELIISLMSKTHDFPSTSGNTVLLSSNVVNSVKIACVRDYSCVWTLVSYKQYTVHTTIFLTGGGQELLLGGQVPPCPMLATPLVWEWSIIT